MINFFKDFVLVLIFCVSFTAVSATNSTFENYCKVCHDPSMAPMFNAPAAHNREAWDQRKSDAFSRALSKNSSLKNLSESEKYECIINELLATAKEGTAKGMPPKGTCMDCTDDELKSAIKFISSN